MSTRALESLQREQQSQKLMHFGRGAVLWMATILSFAAIVLLAADKLYSPSAFVIDQLKIKGQFERIEPESIEQVVMKQASLGNFFSINLDEIKRIVETMSWM
jgi:cell division septal protein FtsQ